MSELSEILKNEYKKKEKAKPIDLSMLMEMVEHLYDAIEPEVIGEGGEEKRRPQSPGRARRERKLRLPLQFPTEISVGQTPGDADREMFELWMSKIAPGAPIKDKIQSIQEFINNPPSVKYSVADTLSYLMFVQTFAFIIREFNASVAGFLWEPFLAAMVGEGSIQVPTSMHDIADVRLKLRTNEGLIRVSLKILREEGNVGGSFVDLVRHFKENPKEPMVYLVIKKLENDTHMKFYQFPVSIDTFFEFIGHPKLQVEYAPVLKPWSWAPQDRVIRTKSPSAALRDLRAQDPEHGYYRWRVIKITDSEGNDLEGAALPGEQYNVYLEEPTKIAGDPGQVAGMGPAAARLWGSPEEYVQWYSLWRGLVASGKGHEFWNLVLEGKEGVTPNGKPARGIKEKEQFEVSAGVLKTKKVADLGTLDISNDTLDQAFANGAESIGEDLTNLFTAMAELVEDVSRFFLIDCGDPLGSAVKCGPDDEKMRAESGKDAIDEATLIKDVVERTITPTNLSRPAGGADDQTQRVMHPTKPAPGARMKTNEEKDLTNDDEVVIIEIER